MMSVRACLRRAAVGVNLFRVYRTEPSLFTRTYITLSYLFVTGFGAVSVMLVKRLLESSQLVYQCETSPTLERMCPAQLTLCSCPDSAALRMHVCDGAGAENSATLAGCACCWYGRMPTETILLLLSTQIGGLWTFLMGVCVVILAVLRVVGSGEDGAPAPPTLTLNPVGQDDQADDDDDDDDDPQDAETGMRASLEADLETLAAAGRGRSRIVDL